MRRFGIGLVLWIGAAAAAGCGHVEGNYPRPRTEKPRELPRELAYQGHARQLTWLEEGQVHGFSKGIHPARKIEERMHAYAEMGNTEARQAEELFAGMARKGLYFTKLVTFLAADESRSFRRGDFEIVFADGTSVRDEGAFLYPAGESRAESSLTRRLTISGQDDPQMKGCTLFLFLPGECAEKTLSRVALHPAQDEP